METVGVHNNFTQPWQSNYQQPAPVYRDQIDARRAGVFTPEAQYPYGYLGDTRSRREERLVTALRHRTNQRNYTRGVHAGSRVDPSDYVWPQYFTPTSGLEAQAAGVKQRPFVEFSREGTHLVNDGKPMPRGAESLATLSQYRSPWS